MTANRTTLRVALLVAPILLSLLITAVLVLAVGKDPIEVMTAILEGAFRNSNAIAGVVNFWIPLTFACLGLVITFTAGLWNIGVEGQMMMGAVFASWAARTIVLPTPLLIPIEIVLAMAGGAFWGVLVGVLRVRLGVNEIFGGVALNALASVIVIYLISGPWQPPEGGSAQSTPPFPAESLLPEMSPEFPVSLLALVLALVIILTVYFALRGTRWGLNLKATGKNPRSALLLGVPTTQTALSAFIVCGAIAGIGGAYRVLFTFDSLRPLPSGGIGFLGLLVVLMVANHPLIAPIVGFVFATILAGSTRLRVVLQLDQSLAEVLQGFVVLLVLMANGLRGRILSSPRSSPEVVQEQPAPTTVTSAAEAASHE
ncbi:MAG: ABC transporter permease [Anaerolineae bacterium]|nr:ABC transporter permease [Anaerolineae bacterium]